MIEFHKEQKGENTFLTCAVEESVLDGTLSGMLLRNQIPGLLPYATAQMDRQRICSYNITSKVSLRQYFSRPVSREKLLNVFLGILNTVIESEEYLIRPEDLVFDSDYIYVSVSDGAPSLLCLPMENHGMGGELLPLFREIMFETTFDEGEDRSYVAELIGFMKKSESGQPKEFRSYLESLRAPQKAQPGAWEPAPAPRPTPTPAATGATPPAPPVSIPAPAPSPAPAKEPVASPKEEKKRFGLFGGGKKEKKERPLKKEKPAAGEFSFNIPGVTPKSRPEPVVSPAAAAETPAPSAPAPAFDPPRSTPAVAPIVVDLGSEETTFWGQDTPAPLIATPFITQLRGGKSQRVDRFPFRLGKERSYVDFCVEGNPAVSRSHADIRCENGQYWIADNNSKNRTFINDQPVLPGQPQRLESGMHFFMANEEFVFELR